MRATFQCPTLLLCASTLKMYALLNRFGQFTVRCHKQTSLLYRLLFLWCQTSSTWVWTLPISPTHLYIHFVYLSWIHILPIHVCSKLSASTAFLPCFLDLSYISHIPSISWRGMACLTRSHGALLWSSSGATQGQRCQEAWPRLGWCNSFNFTLEMCNELERDVTTCNMCIQYTCVTWSKML